MLGWGGYMIQCMDLDREAHTLLKANPIAICVETQDRGTAADPTLSTPLDPEMVEQVAGFLAWLHLRGRRPGAVPVPLERCSRWDGAGLGYHYEVADVDLQDAVHALQR